MKSGTGQSLPLLLPKDPARALRSERRRHQAPPLPAPFLWQGLWADFAPLLLWILTITLLEQRLGNKRRSHQKRKGNGSRRSASCRSMVFPPQIAEAGSSSRLRSLTTSLCLPWLEPPPAERSGRAAMGLHPWERTQPQAAAHGRSSTLPPSTTLRVVGFPRRLVLLPGHDGQRSPCHWVQMKLHSIFESLHFPSGFRGALFRRWEPVRADEGL